MPAGLPPQDSPKRTQAPGLISEEAFQAANTPGRGSDVGDFVPGKKGGWVPRNHPDAITGTDQSGGPPDHTDGGPDSDYSAEGGPAGPAMAGLQAAADAGRGGSTVVQQLAPPGTSNPNLGQRIYPQAMRQLAMLPRIY